jgi:heme-degrading monooxygenase HmoA
VAAADVKRKVGAAGRVSHALERGAAYTAGRVNCFREARSRDTGAMDDSSAVGPPVATVWRAWSAAGDAEACVRELDEHTLSRLERSRGNRGVTLLWRRDGASAEFVVVSLWASAEDAQAAAGAEAEAAPSFDRQEPIATYDFLIRGDLAFAASLALGPEGV